MAAPSITVNFTSDVQNGVPPFAVQFADATIVTGGFARYWFWDFGDGEISTAQHPLHVFNGTVGDKFTVTLTVLATVSEVASLAFQDLNAAGQAGGEETNGLGSTEAAAWSAFDAASPVGSSGDTAIFALTRTGGATRQYKQKDSVIELSTNFNNSLYVLVMNPGNYEIFQGFINASTGGAVQPPDNTPKQEHSIILGLTTITPVTISVWVTPISNLPDTTGTNQQHGQNVSFSLRSYYPTGTQSFDDLAKADFIVLGIPPVADFTALPKKGKGPLTITFENLSTPAIGAPTTYSWKKRIHGSGDSFAEFSTAENPIEIFTK